MQDILIKQFNEDMWNIYRRALSEAGYKATRFLQMLGEHGGYETAKILINASNVSDGYTALWMRNRLDLTVEAVIMDNPKYHQLFATDEMKVIKKRLHDYGYKTNNSL